MDIKISRFGLLETVVIKDEKQRLLPVSSSRVVNSCLRSHLKGNMEKFHIISLMIPNDKL